MAAKLEAVFSTNNSLTLNITVPVGLVDPAVVVMVTSCARTAAQPTTDIKLDAVGMNIIDTGVLASAYELGVSSGAKVISIVNTLAPDVTVRIVAYVLSSAQQSGQPSQDLSGDQTMTPTKNDCFYLMGAVGPFGGGSSTPIALNDPAGAVAQDSYFNFDGGGWSQSKQHSYLHSGDSNFDFDYDTASNTKIIEILRSPELAIIPDPVVSNIYSNQAKIDVGITDDQGHTITERGIVYNKTGTPTTSDTKVIVTGTTEAFDALMENLDNDDTYYVRAYAISTGEGTGYSNELSFKTERLNHQVNLLMA